MIYDITETDKENLTTILNECELDEQYKITIKKIIERNAITQTELYMINNVILPSI